MSPEEVEKEVKEGEVKRASRAKKEVKEAPTAKKEARVLTKEQIIAAIKSMTVLDLADLVKTLENEFGVSAAPVAVAAAPAAAPGGQAGLAAPADKTEFPTPLKRFCERKIYR